MDFYIIPPNRHLSLMHYGNRYFGLAHHYIQDSQYREYFLDIREENPKAFITMDCGAAEHSTVTESILLDIVAELKPDEIISPDVLFDKEQTLKNLDSFLYKMLSKDYIAHTAIFGCPQGSTKEEWLECYRIMLLNPHVSTIGLSKIAVPRCWHNAVEDKQIALSRNQCVEELQKREWLQKPLHLLGMGEHNEFDYYFNNKVPCIRSSDSCYTVLAAINGICFEDGDVTRIPTTNEYFNTELTEEQKDLAIKNLKFLQNKYKNV
jgi:hypothetical protein